MSIEGQKFQGAEEPTANDLLMLAAVYREATSALQTLGRPRIPQSYHPYRWAAIHAVELYLGAFLLNAGLMFADLKRLQHRLDARVELASEHGLVLQKRTSDLVKDITSEQVYVAARYRPRQKVTTELNQLKAILEEVAKKVEAVLNCK